jgi:phosphatidylglycerophosphate synthase
LTYLSEYRRSLKLPEVEEIFDLYFYRPLAFAFVKAIYGTPITPNQLTVVSMLIGVMGGVCYSLGYPPAVTAGALLYGLSIVLDCSDGQLARLKKNGTRLGRILDGLIDYVVNLAVYIGIGIGLAPEFGDHRSWWLLILAAGLSNLLHSAVLDYYRNRFTDCVQGTGRTEDDDFLSFQREYEELARNKGERPRKAAIWLYLRYLTLQKKLSINGDDSKLPKVGGEEFYRRNKAALRLWTFLGSTTQGTFLILTSLLGRIDLYFWGMIVVGNIWAVVMFIVQTRIDHRLEQEVVS